MSALPDDVRALLDGEDLEARVGLTVELVTVDADGWPRVALLSAGEIVAIGAERLRLALWPASRSAANLERSGRALLALVWEGAAHRVGNEAARGPDIEVAGEARAAFDARVRSVARDEVPYARLRTGITFELPERAPVLARWAAMVAAMR